MASSCTRACITASMPTHSIEVHQNHYSSKLQPFTYRTTPGSDNLDPISRSGFKAKCGELNWLVTQTRLDGSFDASYLAGCSAEPTKKEALVLNNLLLRMKNSTLSLKFKKIADGDLRNLVLISPHDAGWQGHSCKSGDLSHQGGSVGGRSPGRMAA